MTLMSTVTLEKPQNLSAMLTKELPSRFQIKALKMVSHQILIALKRNKEEQTLPVFSPKWGVGGEPLKPPSNNLGYLHNFSDAGLD